MLAVIVVGASRKLLVILAVVLVVLVVVLVVLVVLSHRPPKKPSLAKAPRPPLLIGGGGGTHGRPGMGGTYLDADARAGGLPYSNDEERCRGESLDVNHAWELRYWNLNHGGVTRPDAVIGLAAGGGGGCNLFCCSPCEDDDGGGGGEVGTLEGNGCLHGVWMCDGEFLNHMA